MRQLCVVSLLIAAMSSHGCGTVLTVVHETREDIKRTGPGVEEACSIPNMYSGTALDLCVLRYGTDNFQALSFWDMPLSFAADTLLLPLTIYLQLRYGHLWTKQTDASHTTNISVSPIDDEQERSTP